MKKLTTLSIMALFCANVHAQPTNEIILKNDWYMMCGQVNVKKANKKTIWVMPDTENSWIKDSVLLEEYPTVKRDSLYRNQKAELYFNKKKMLYLTLQCKLAIQGDETVLHCYFPLSADYVENLWLASEETAIVDMETGVQYRAKRTFPDCMRKHISIKAKNNADDEVIDFQIFFPKLPETTKSVAIFGVPTWYMRGSQIQLDNRQPTKDLSITYDTVPYFKEPRLVRAESNYDRNNHESWPAYTDAHLIKPVKDGTMALWRTREATYLAIAREQNWSREYFGIHKDAKLLTESGQCSLKEIIGLPIGHIFWIEGYSGDYFAYVLVFEPLPENATTFTFKEPDGEPFNMWGAHWGGQTIRNLNVSELRKNQSLFEYNPRVIKE